MNRAMDNVEKKLKESWQRIKSYEEGAVKLGIPHLLEWYVAYETPVDKALVIISKTPIEDLDSSKSISTTCRKREDGCYYISFRLTERVQEDVFINMCSNLIEYSSNALSEVESLKKVSYRFKQWQRLMQYQNKAILSDERRRGLIGELLYLQETMDNNVPVDVAIKGWVGPDGADQDFVYDKKWREIKTTGLASDKITISSIEQLGGIDDFGELVVYKIDSCAPEMEGAFSLRDLVKRVSMYFNRYLELNDMFNEKLCSVGYIDLEIYDKYPYKFFDREIYDVDDRFPRITRQDIRPEIVLCSYSLSLSSINNWKRG